MMKKYLGRMIFLKIIIIIIIIIICELLFSIE